MLFCIYEVFEAVNTAGLSMKMIRYCFSLKRNAGFWFNHTISRLLAHSLRVYFYVLRIIYRTSWSSIWERYQDFI